MMHPRLTNNYTPVMCEWIHPGLFLNHYKTILNELHIIMYSNNSIVILIDTG